MLLAVLGVKGQVGDLNLAILLGHLLHLTVLAILPDTHLGQFQREGLIAVQLQGDHREVVGVHIVHFRGENAHGIQLLVEGILLVPLLEGLLFQQPGRRCPVVLGQIGLRQGQPVGVLQAPQIPGLLIVVHRLGVAAPVQGVPSLLHSLLIGLIGADIPVQQKAAYAHRQGRHNDDGQQPLLFAALGGGGLTIPRSAGSGRINRPRLGRLGRRHTPSGRGSRLLYGGLLRRSRTRLLRRRLLDRLFLHRSGLRLMNRLLRCRRSLILRRRGLVLAHRLQGLFQRCTAVPAEFFCSGQLGAASITKHTHLPLSSVPPFRGNSTDVISSLLTPANSVKVFLG